MYYAILELFFFSFYKGETNNVDLHMHASTRFLSKRKDLEGNNSNTAVELREK